MRAEQVQYTVDANPRPVGLVDLFQRPRGLAVVGGHERAVGGSLRAVARPMPCAAPVTKAMLPS